MSPPMLEALPAPNPAPNPAATPAASPAASPAATAPGGLRWPAFTRHVPTLHWLADGLHEGLQSWPSFDAWCQAHAGQPCRLRLGLAWLHETLAEPTLPLADDAAALAWAGPLLQHYHGETAAAWPLAAWQAGPRRGVSALHGASLPALLATANAHGVRLLQVQAAWPQRLQSALAAHPGLHAAQARLLLQEPGWVGVLDLQHGQLVAIQRRRATEHNNERDSGADWLAEHGNTWLCGPGAVGGERGERGAGVDGAVTRLWAPGAAGAQPAPSDDQTAIPSAARSNDRSNDRPSGWPSAWPSAWPGLGLRRAAIQPADFLRPQRGLHRLAWPAAATALLVLGLAATEAQQAWAARAAAQQALRLAQGMPGMPATPGQPAARTAPAAPAALASASAAAQAVAAVGRADRLARPWPAIFQALDTAQRPGVVWLGLQVADSGALRLQGQAPATASALAAAEALGQAKGLQAVLPGRVETTPAGLASFDVQAQAAAPWR